MKKVLFALLAVSFFSTQAFANFQFHEVPECQFPGVEIKYYSNTSSLSGLRVCDSDVEKINKYKKYYRSLYKKCEKRHSRQTWCQEYKTEWKYYKGLLGD